MKAQGKREARRPGWPGPWNIKAWKAEIYTGYFALSGLDGLIVLLTRGDALRACPWLSYFAPLALSFRPIGALIPPYWRSHSALLALSLRPIGALITPIGAYSMRWRW